MNMDENRMMQLARIGGEILAVPDEREALQTTVTKAMEFVPGCSTAAVSRHHRGGWHVVAHTHETALHVETVQVELGEGPTVASHRRTNQCTVVDPRAEARWPTWAAWLRGLGITGLISLILAVGTERLGVLTLTTTQAEGFARDAVPVAEAFSQQAAVALFAARQATTLQDAVEAKHRIGIAQGILANRYSLTKEQAFALLRRYSNTTNTKLRDVATLVYELGDLPPGFTPRTHHSSTPLDELLPIQRRKE